MSDEWSPDPVPGEQHVTLEGWPAVAEADLGEVPSAVELRRFTRKAARTRAGASLGSLLGDVYYAIVVAGTGVLLGLGIAQQLRVALPPPPVTGDFSLSVPTLVAVLLLALAGGLLSLAGRLGPVGAGGAEAAWWLGLPVDRRALLRPAALRLPVVAALVLSLLVGVLDGGLLADDGGHLLRGALSGALAGVLLVLAAGLAQTLGASRRAIAVVGDLVMLAALVAAVLLATAGLSFDRLPVPTWSLVAVLAVVVAGLALLMDSRLARIRERGLRESGSVASQAAGALVSMDSRELGRALSDGSARPTRRWVSALRTARGPATALVTADLVVLRRSVRHLAQLVVTAAVVALVTVLPQLATELGVVVAVLVGGYLAASATAEGARRAEMAPILDRLLPLGPTAVRRLRMVVPALVMLVWSLAVFTALGHWAGNLPGWLALGIASTPAWAAAAVRAAYRPAPDWQKPLVSTPMGALPTGVASVLARGPDVVVLGMLPLWIAIVLRSVSPTLVMAQVVTSVVAVLVASSTSTKSFMERAMEAQEADRTARGGTAR
ncbi:DUF6297 family protein [Cellulomonas citrea]|uniref:DUF6297 family protein n=1 Tax=Cellulomonas citrea TaxID=1909423 RepID=UPI001F39F587|nr:DUF6297 family protein [Cellulomonas citrea]